MDGLTAAAKGFLYRQVILHLLLQFPRRMAQNLLADHRIPPILTGFAACASSISATSLFSIDIIKVPLAHPEQAKIVGQPAHFRRFENRRAEASTGCSKDNDGYDCVWSFISLNGRAVAAQKQMSLRLSM